MLPTAPKPSEAGLTKCWVLFHNQAKKTFRSYDSSGRYEVADPRAYGIRGLKKMVDRWGTKVVSKAILYDVASGLPLEQFQDGQWVPAQA
jgi:hypothetical protein